MGGDRQEVKECWCKVCGKSFPCGRSLGGHMRSHLSLSSPAPMADERPARSNRSCINEFGIGYGLRENPKKTWRLSDPAGDAQKHEKFPSLKALLGHMKRHSEKPRCELEEEGAEELENERGVEKKGASPEKGPETEVLVPGRKRKRSRRLTPISGSSSSASEIDKEQEDAALTLMMLSRDTDCRNCINSVGEAPPHLNSVVSVAKSAPMTTWKKNSQCGVQHHRNGLGSSGLDVSCAAFMKPEAHTDDADGIEFSLEAASNSKSLISSNDVMFPKADTKLSSEQLSVASDGHLHKTPKKGSQYECSVCNRRFNSYQSLGGHRASHHIRIKGCAGTRAGGSNNNKKKKNRNNAYSGPKIIDKFIDKNACSGSSSGPTKKVNKHKCPICHKVFSSSQALGGHKRSHLLASSKGYAYRQTAAADVLDVNLPAPAKEGSHLHCDNFWFRSWWVRSHSRSKPLASLISN